MAYGGITLLPASIIELNMKVATDSQQSLMLKRQTDTDFADIPTEPRKLKREISLPAGTDWNIDNFDPYLETLNEFETDGIVPEGERVRCSSISSASSFHDDIHLGRSCTVKTFSTVRMDSGSTCISSDFMYESAKQKCENWLDPEETYQNLDLFVQEVPEVIVNTDTLSSVSQSLPSSSSGDNAIMEFPTLQSYGSPLSSTVFDSLTEKISSASIKRRLDSNSEDEVFITKQTKQEYKVEDCRYVEIRRKNNIASKNCRKTRKEKQREMEHQVAELEQEKETLSVKIQVLEEMIKAHRACLFNAIGQRR